MRGSISNYDAYLKAFETTLWLFDLVTNFHCGDTLLYGITFECNSVVKYSKRNCRYGQKEQMVKGEN